MGKHAVHGSMYCTANFDLPVAVHCLFADCLIINMVVTEALRVSACAAFSALLHGQWFQSRPPQTTPLLRTQCGRKLQYTHGDTCPAIAYFETILEPSSSAEHGHRRCCYNFGSWSIPFLPASALADAHFNRGFSCVLRDHVIV